MNTGNNLCLLVNVRPSASYSVMPLSILALGGNLVAAGFDVKLYDGSNEKEFIESIINDLLSLKPAFVGLSVMTHSLKYGSELTRTIKHVSPETMIIWGGVHPTLFPDQTIKVDEVDLVVIGEGHETLVEILKRISSGEVWDDVPGICYKKDGEIIINSPEMSGNYTIKPMPYHLIEIDKYDKYLHLKDKLRKIDVISSIGCPFKCRFCINVARKRSYRKRDLVEFMDELQLLQQKYDVGFFSFMDEYFFSSIERIEEFLELKRQRGLKFYWDASSRADFFRTKFTDDFLIQLHDEGCVEIKIGAESGSQRVLDIINKKILVDDILLANTMSIKSGVRVSLSFMAGIPGETFEDLKLTKNLIMRLQDENPNVVILGPQLYRPYPGAPLTDDATDYGLKLPNTINGWIELIDSAVFGGALDVNIMPWVNNPKTTDKMIKYLAVYKRTKIRAEVNYLIKIMNVIAFRFIKFRLKYNLYSFPIELFMINLLRVFRNR